MHTMSFTFLFYYKFINRLTNRKRKSKQAFAVSQRWFDGNTNNSNVGNINSIINNENSNNNNIIQ